MKKLFLIMQKSGLEKGHAPDEKHRHIYQALMQEKEEE